MDCKYANRVISSSSWDQSQTTAYGEIAKMLQFLVLWPGILLSVPKTAYDSASYGTGTTKSIMKTHFLAFWLKLFL